MKLAIYAITLNGARQGKRLKKSLPFADLFVSEAGAEKMGDVAYLPLPLPLSGFVAERFNHYDGHIFICASGIVSRVTGPLLADKRSDPALVCLDEQATFAISMLSGHRGGGNALTEHVAHIVKATPVITTASDVQENIAVDMLGAPFGWVLDPVSEPSITRVSAAVVNEQPVLIAQQAGEKNWWRYPKRMPASILTHTGLGDVESSNYAGAVLISDINEPETGGWQDKLVLWRPKSLVLGIGCDRNTPLTVLKAGLAAFSQQFNLSLDSVSAIASIDLKADEKGLLELSEDKQWPFFTYAPDQLDKVEGIENPSAYVKKVTGSCSVAEAAALRQSDTSALVVAKWTFKQDGYNMTLACCRRQFEEPLIQQKRKNWLGARKHGSEERHGESLSRKSVAAEQTTGTEANSAQAITINAHGSEVVAGYQCKPKHVDLNRSMLHYQHHILLCEGARCAKAGSKNLAHELRGILKDLQLASGDQRIKVSRTMCAGACRNRATMVIYQRFPKQASGAIGPVPNHALWLRNIEELSEAQWRTLFMALAESRPLNQVLEPHYFAPIDQQNEAPSEED